MTINKKKFKKKTQSQQRASSALGRGKKKAKSR